MSAYQYPGKIPLYKILLKSSQISKNPLPFHHRNFEKFGGSFAISSLFGKEVMLTRDAEITKHILKKNHKNYHKSIIQTKFLSKYIGNGLLTSNGSYWLKQRRLIQPAFHKEKLQKLIVIMEKAIQKEVEAFPLNRYVDAYSILNQLAFKVVAKSLFSYSVDEDVMLRLQEIIESIQHFIVKELRQPHKNIWYTISGQIRKHLKLANESKALINAIIEERRTSNEIHDDLLDMLLNATYEDDGSKMTNEQLIDEILILFVAGHETTANALTFTLQLLATHPEKCTIAKKESDEVPNSDNAMEKIAKLSYTKNCIEETMRLYPPAWITDRVALEDDSFASYRIKKGTIIGISFYELHRNKAYWEFPDDFIPERFSAAQRKDTSGYYFPFGAGPRLCIGNSFAIYEMVLSIYEILKRYTIAAEKDTIEINPLITLKPIDVKLKFEPISN